MFKTSQEHKLYTKLSKCRFRVSKIEYLGHVISAKWVKANSYKVLAMLEWPRSRNVKALPGFLGLTGYYRKFIKHHGAIEAPLIQLLGNNSFTLTQEAKKAFQGLKQVVTNQPVL